MPKTFRIMGMALLAGLVALCWACSGFEARIKKAAHSPRVQEQVEDLKNFVRHQELQYRLSLYRALAGDWNEVVNSE